MYSSEPLPHFVSTTSPAPEPPDARDIDGFTRTTTISTICRVRRSTKRRRLNDFGRRLAAIDPGTLTADEKLDRPWLELSIKARTHELGRCAPGSATRITTPT